mmetsp:Transcript_11077/g.16578  ORF Transcript_11077/g.16578 Transcript_11077/m.16578 type:complete len:184 (-) Transcript_11077:213-764(-)|eukprot:CAMPEP_0167760176 /NCGR_PEP_ID=MMETSP0110_2-20121227/11441_1 /TAXON_ID=629695 /ORGANISM="Gymnochlora sp., Strain CCMP2014" /LENGTH=183 /DNA_ID=CAMNT_0007646659 /DNA_START=258 /DNA_END=809 /DNA_ORIENTATION=-
MGAIYDTALESMECLVEMATRKPIKRIRNALKLFQRGQYVSLVWYLVSASIHLAFAASVFLMFMTFLRTEFVVLVMVQPIGKEVNRKLKQYFNQRRPAESGKQSLGMPSYHSQHAFFFATYILMTGLVKSWIPPTIQACAVAYSRLALQVHSFDQIAVGAGIGVIQGFLSSCIVLITLQWIRQ